MAPAMLPARPVPLAVLAGVRASGGVEDAGREFALFASSALRGAPIADGEPWRRRRHALRASSAVRRTPARGFGDPGRLDAGESGRATSRPCATRLPHAP